MGLGSRFKRFTVAEGSTGARTFARAPAPPWTYGLAFRNTRHNSGRSVAPSVRWRTDGRRCVAEDERMMNLHAIDPRRLAYPAAMRYLLLILLVAALLGASGWASLVGAQGTHAAAGGSRAAAERAAVDLKYGMTPDEVQKLLGKPWRTALSANGGAAGAPWQGTLRWTYTWNASSSAAERNLNIDFNGKTAEQWNVSGWSWAGY